MPTFDGKSEKVKVVEDLLQTSFKIHNQATEANKNNYFHSFFLMRGDALKRFKNTTSLNRVDLGDTLNVFCRKYEKPQSMATAKHKYQRLVFNPANQKIFDFLDQLQNIAKDAFGATDQAIIEPLIYTKLPLHLRKSINQAHLENRTYEKIVLQHIEKGLELNGLEAPEDLQINTGAQQATEQNPEKPKSTCHHCKKPGHYRNQCHQLKREKDQAQKCMNSGGKDNNTSNRGQTSSNAIKKVSYNTKTNNTIN